MPNEKKTAEEILNDCVSKKFVDKNQEQEVLFAMESFAQQQTSELRKVNTERHSELTDCYSKILPLQSQLEELKAQQEEDINSIQQLMSDKVHLQSEIKALKEQLEQCQMRLRIGNGFQID